MIEYLLFPNGDFKEDTGNVLFLFDTATATDLIGSTPSVTYIGTAAIDPAYTIDGVATVNFPATTAGMNITFQTPMNLQGKNWTIEWSSINTNVPTGYAMEFGMTTPTAGIGIWGRWGDAGFGNRIHFGTSLSVANNTWAPPLTKANTVNTLNHWALSCKNGQIRVFCNGQIQILARGTSGTYNLPSFPPMDNISSLTKITLGWQASSVPALLGHHGRIRISDFARYTRSYVVAPLE